jgi:hypothetical protein
MNFPITQNRTGPAHPGFVRLLNLADQLVETSAKAKYSRALAACGIDSEFLTRLRVKVLQATLNPRPEYGLLTDVAAMCLQIQSTADSMPLTSRSKPSEILADFRIARN